MSKPKIIRLDKYLCDMGIGSRKEVKTYCKKGRVSVNGNVTTSSDLKVNIDDDMVLFDNKKIEFVEYEYYMLNKPMGVVSATVDNTCKTVVDLIGSARKKDLFPVGRLDKDTVGLLLITDNGELAHELLSPDRHVPKTYYVKVQGELKEEYIKMCRDGIKLDNDFTTRPSELKIISCGEISEAELTICEGKFHQVKRMMSALGCNVIYLKRISMGSLVLDEHLKEGEYRKLADKEINDLMWRQF